MISGKVRTVFRPEARGGDTKYGSRNNKGMMLEREKLEDGEWEQMGDLYSLGLAKGTWSSYNTAERMLRCCFEERGIPLVLPLSEENVLTFIHWLTFTRELAGSTIETYLSGVRQMHVARGIEERFTRSERIKVILKGIKHRDITGKRQAGKESRKPITPEILSVLKERIADTDFLGRDQRMIWSVCSVLFHGAFRVHELLCKKSGSFDPDFTLLGRDIELAVEDGGGVLRIRIKAPKEERVGKSVIVDVYETGTLLCPVRAFKKWQKYGVREPDMPVFRFKTGTPLTGKRLNEIIRACLKGHVEGCEALFSSHSFRAGAASLMASLGYSDEDIKAMGRWSSRAFLEYVKLPRSNRAEVARRMGK